MPDTLTLSAASLFSKAGFNDGDMPDELSEWLDEPRNGWSREDAYRAADREVWDRALAFLVRDRLLPAMAPAHVEIEVVGGIHNPVRATTYDGHDVRKCWYGDEPPPPVSACVEVSFAQVAAVLREIMGQGAA